MKQLGVGSADQGGGKRGQTQTSAKIAKSMGEPGCAFGVPSRKKREGENWEELHASLPFCSQRQHTHDDTDGAQFPNHEAAREHGHRIVRELTEDGYQDGVLLVHDERGEIVHSIPF
jgi:hypothetical protein